MVSEVVKVINKEGFHMRPANAFIKEMTAYKSDVTIVFNDKEINGKSIMNIMAACIKYDSEVEIRCSGEDEAEALAHAVEFIKAGMGDPV